MSMAGKRYYGADVPRSTGPHPDPMEQLTELELVRQDAATAWDKCEERRLSLEKIRHLVLTSRTHSVLDEIQGVCDEALGVAVSRSGES